MANYLLPFIRICAQRSATGKILHAIIIPSGLSSTENSFVLNTLRHLYASYVDIASAQKLFDDIPNSSKDVADWTSLMSCFSCQNRPHDDLLLFAQMLENSAEVDDVAMVFLFSACTWLQDVEVGSQGYGRVVKMGFEGRVKVCNALMDMYGKSGMVGEMRRVFGEMKEKIVVMDSGFGWGVEVGGVSNGRKVFDAMPHRNEVAWTIMMVGYVGNRFRLP